MPIIDSDTHVDETDETWEYLADSDQQYRPVTVTQDIAGGSDGTPRGYNRYWLIDGQLRLRRIRDDQRTGTVQQTRELTDVPARLRHMDQLGVDVQVMYPTLFLTQVSGRPEVELALCKAYNRWMASKWAQSSGRLRWVAPLPLHSMGEALEEMAFVKEHGACGVLKKGRECGGRPAGNPYFLPLYQEAGKLDIPVCFHLGSGDPTLPDAVRGMGILEMILPVVDAFHSLLTYNIPTQMQDTRFGFIETTASWVPYMVTELHRTHGRMSWMRNFELHQDILAENRLYVSCDNFDDMDHIMSLTGDSNFVIGSDYGHADMSAEIDALAIMERKGQEGELNKSLRSQNPRQQRPRPLRDQWKSLTETTVKSLPP